MLLLSKLFENSNITLIHLYIIKYLLANIFLILVKTKQMISQEPQISPPAKYYPAILRITAAILRTTVHIAQTTAGLLRISVTVATTETALMTCTAVFMPVSIEITVVSKRI